MFEVEDQGIRFYIQVSNPETLNSIFKILIETVNNSSFNKKGYLLL